MTGVGTDVLFENHTVKEIQEIEKKLRNDIERKKEELRQMVGERYRDLMEAADTITEMKLIARNVTKSVKSIENRCTSLQRSSLQNGVLFAIQDKISERKKSKESLNTLAAQIKILMDSPTKIWSSMESKNFSDSVCLYLLAKHVHSLLVLSTDARSQFPVIDRQWASISQFRSILLENSQKVLESQEAEPEDVLEPVCCLCLLTNSSVQQIFVEFIKTRQNVIKNIFQDDKAAKDQVCEFVSVVQMTLKIVYVLFYPVNDNFTNNGLEKNLLHHALTKLLSAKEQGPVSLLDLKSSEIFKFLPSDVRDFRPVLNCNLEKCDVKFLQAKCISWLDVIQTNLQGDLGALLNYVKSVKNLSLIRESLFEKFSEIKLWDMMCNDLLSKAFSIWDFFLKDCFLRRIQDIINEASQKASELCQRDIEWMLSNIGSDTTASPRSKVERNLSLYVWSESAHDIVSSVAWLPRHHRHYWDSGELSMKSMGFTPKVQSLCKELDEGVRQMLEDVATFVHPRERQMVIEESIAEGMKQETDTIHGYIACAVEERFLDLLNFVEANLKYLESEKDSVENSCRIVFLGHMCNGLANLCPHINVALSCEKMTERNTRLKSTAPTAKECEKWKALKSKLLETSANAFRLWSRSQVNTLRSSVEAELTTDSVEGVLKILLQWDRIEIQEESEQGKAVHSILRIPQHLSTPVANALFTFCCQLNAIGGFSINCEVRSSISKQLLLSLLEVYRRKTDSGSDESLAGGLLQVQSLQLLFDVHFLTGLMTHKEVQAMSQEVVARCVSHIDPFDMDVFAQPLQQNVKRALQKSLSLYGLIASHDQVSYLNSCRFLSHGGQMDHNVILMSPGLSRFPHLPLPTKSSVVSSSSQEQLPLQPREEEEVKNIHSHSSSPNLVAIDTNPLKSTASFYEKVTAMSSSWFGN